MVTYYYLSIASSVRVQWRRGAREQATAKGGSAQCHTLSLIVLTCVFTEQIVFSGEESSESQQGGNQAASQ